MQAFLETWSLFGNAYLCCLALAFVLPIFGLALVAREQIFLAAAIGQAATLGIAVTAALTAFAGVAAEHSHDQPHEDARLAIPVATLFAVGATLWVSRGGRRVGEAPALVALVFLLGSSLSVVLLANHPHGLHEVQRLMFSSLIGATPVEAWLALGTAAIAGLAISVPAIRERWLLVLTDTATAGVLGLRPRRWLTGQAVVLGLVIAFSIRCAGSLFTFGVMILPVLTAKGLVKTTRGVLWLAPCLSLLLAWLGLMHAHHQDWPPGQSIVAWNAAATLLAYGVASWRRGARG